MVERRPTSGRGAEDERRIVPLLKVQDGTQRRGARTSSWIFLEGFTDLLCFFGGNSRGSRSLTRIQTVAQTKPSKNQENKMNQHASLDPTHPFSFEDLTQPDSLSSFVIILSSSFEPDPLNPKEVPWRPGHRCPSRRRRRPPPRADPPWRCGPFPPQNAAACGLGRGGEESKGLWFSLGEAERRKKRRGKKLVQVTVIKKLTPVSIHEEWQVTLDIWNSLLLGSEHVYHIP